MAAIAKAVIVLLSCLAAAGLAGTFVDTWLGFAPLRSGTAIVPLVLWFGLGAVAGFAAFGAAGAWAAPARAGDWTRRPEAPGLANLIVGADFAALFALAVLFKLFFWGRGNAGGFLVPASPPHAMLFLAAAAFAVAVARTAMLPGSRGGEDD